MTLSKEAQPFHLFIQLTNKAFWPYRFPLGVLSYAYKTEKLPLSFALDLIQIICYSTCYFVAGKDTFLQI